MADGGSLIGISVHALDLALYLLRYSDVTEVSGTMRDQFGGCEDYVHLSVE